MFRVENVSLFFSKKPLFKSFNLEISNGDICLLRAKSGAGKTSLLRWIAGISDINMTSKGRIYLNGCEITKLPAEKRQIGILFSEPMLFPHLTVEENIGIGIAASVQRKKRNELIHDNLAKAGLHGMEKRDPLSLSTGQQTRVSLIRTVLSKPHLLLLDEPFSNLDEDIRKITVNYVLEEIKLLNIPVLMVSHDPRDNELSTNRPITFTTF